MGYRILILIPKLDLSGPSRGSIALLNGLKDLGVDAEILPLNASANDISNANMLLTEEKFFFKKIKKLQNYLNCFKSHSRQPILVSFCLQADFLALVACDRSHIISSVRGNLLENYSDDFRFIGKFLGFIHYWILRKFTVITALNLQMKTELLNYNKKTELIPNFIDELNIPSIDQGASGIFKFVFVGSLSKRKAVIDLIHAFMPCIEAFPDTELNIIGDGPLKTEVENLIIKYKASASIKLHGFVSEPMSIVKRCDVFVLPSFSEGISRAAMEALFLGKRCIMQNVDGNAELILTEKQGILIENLNNLSSELIKMRCSGRVRDIQRLPSNFRQKSCCQQFISVFEKYFVLEKKIINIKKINREGH